MESVIEKVVEKEKIKVLLVDDHNLVREGFAKMLELEPDMDVVGQAANGEEACTMVEELKPHVVLMDIRLPGFTGIEATKLIKEKFPSVEVIILSMYDEEEYISEAIRAGASSYVLKDISKDELVRAIRVVRSGESLIQPVLAKKILKGFANLVRDKEIAEVKAAIGGLSNRELQVLRLAAQGQANKQIAQTLTISEMTVKAYLRSIFTKLEVNGRTEAVAYAMRKGWVK